MYRENTFEVLNNRHDNFNFKKVLQKRKEFYTNNVLVRGQDTPLTQNYDATKRLQYSNDFIDNIHDKYLVTNITGGEPTYHNQILYKNLQNNLNKMTRAMYPKGDGYANSLSETRADMSYYQQSTSDLSVLQAKTPQNKYASKVDICVGDADIKLTKRPFLSNMYSNRTVKPSLLHSSAEKMFQRKSVHTSTRYNTIMKHNMTVNSSINKPSTSDSKMLPNIHGNKFASMVETPNRIQRNHQEGTKLLSMSPIRPKNKFPGSHTNYLIQNTRLMSSERYPVANTTLNKSKEKVVKKSKVQFRSKEPASINPKPDDRFMYIIPEGSDITCKDLKVIRINLTDYVNYVFSYTHNTPEEDPSLLYNVKYQRMGVYEKLEVTKPSIDMQNQFLRLLLEQIENYEKSFIKVPKANEGEEIGYNFLYNTCGERIDSIFDISKATKVLIAAKNKYNLKQIKATGAFERTKADFDDKKNSISTENDKKDKEVQSTIRHACVEWLRKNLIPLDSKFRDIKIGNKVTRITQNKAREPSIEENTFSLQESMTDDDILERVIEQTIKKQQKARSERQFYDSLKPTDSNEKSYVYCR
ncbi:unnamed protein product [Moneuplotes crassus]|uniref:Uncharacterized protein n=1 Tax=Euplotes crassus TaxID=5936 RepID=A0AAD1XYS3_EUPCR|nr:unnamed protein product [Moneuplotes crassus]